MKHYLFAALTLCLSPVFAQTYQMQPVPIQSRWARLVSPDNALKEYPRPQMVRAGWQNLNGLWDYAITGKDAMKPDNWNGRILVPYPIESALSGVKKALQPNQTLWYKRSFDHTSIAARTLLHFGAVDYQATVYLNGQEVGRHEGGYTEFTFDITAVLKPGKNQLVVKVYDPTDQGIGPHGKQVLNPANIYYTPSSGIWQTVWLEQIPDTHIDGLTITPDVDRALVSITVHGTPGKTVTIQTNSKAYPGKANEPILIKLPNAKLWSPATPNLYDFTATLGADKVSSYFGMRKISVAKDKDGKDRIFLNNKPYYNLGTLDQGFWPDGLYTAPTDEALAFDIKAIKAMGFNTIRKHIKVEPARWYYWADKLGMLVWQDLVNPNQRLPEGSKTAFEKQSAEEVAQLHNAPSIVTWVLFNEKWGQYDQERLTKWLKAADPSRIVNGHTGELLYVNEQLRSPAPNAYIGADMTDVHAYPDPMNSLKQDGKAQVCGEFGGIGVFIPDHQWLTGSAWGYVQEKPAALAAKYKVMNQHLQLFAREGMSGSIYTQPFDVEGEQNGLMTYDREVIKIPFAELRSIHSPLNSDMGTIPQVSAQNADLTEPGLRYSQLLQQYIDGKREPAFLKQLAMLATQAGDKPGADLAGKAYLATLKAPYGEDDLQFIIQSAKSTKDEGFRIMISNPELFKKALGDRPYTTSMINLILKYEMQPLMQQKKSWSEIAAAVKDLGAPGEEILLRAQTIDYFNTQQWDNYKKVAKIYLQKYGQYLADTERNTFQKALTEHE